MAKKFDCNLISIFLQNTIRAKKPKKYKNHPKPYMDFGVNKNIIVGKSLPLEAMRSDLQAWFCFEPNLHDQSNLCVFVLQKINLEITSVFDCELQSSKNPPKTT